MSALIYILWGGKVFEETAVGISDALFISGFDAQVVFVSDTDNFIFCDENLYIILGINRYRCSLPRHFIAIQAEQISSNYITPEYLSILSKASYVWDFSDRNVEYFKDRGIPCSNIGSRVPMDVFYPESPSMLRHFSNRKKDIDVLFYGAKCDRREKIEKKLTSLGLKVAFRYNNLFREGREELIARSKVVLNIHYYVPSSLETHRIEYLCSRGKCVISERSEDLHLDNEYEQSVVFVSLNDMVDTVLAFVKCEEAIHFVEVGAQKQSILRQSNTRVIVESLKNITVQMKS